MGRLLAAAAAAAVAAAVADEGGGLPGRMLGLPVGWGGGAGCCVGVLDTLESITALKFWEMRARSLVACSQPMDWAERRQRSSKPVNMLLK